MATAQDYLERHLVAAAKVAGVEAPALDLTAALGKAAIAAGLTPLALDLEEVRGRTEKLKRDLVSSELL